MMKILGKTAGGLVNLPLVQAEASTYAAINQVNPQAIEESAGETHAGCFAGVVRFHQRDRAVRIPMKVSPYLAMEHEHPKKDFAPTKSSRWNDCWIDHSQARDDEIG